MTAINTNSSIKTFFVNNWLTMILIVALGVGIYVAIRYFTDLSSKNEAIQQLLDTHTATLADKEREITALTASYGKQQAQIDAARVKYDTDIAAIQLNLQGQIDVLRRARTARVATLTANPSELSSEFARRFGLTQVGTP